MSRVVGIDVGKKGGIVYGDNINEAFTIPYPETGQEFFDLGKKIWQPGAKVFIEKTIGTVYRTGGAKCPTCFAPKHIKQMDVSARVLNFHNGCFKVALNPFKVTSLAPASWRRLVFGYHLLRPQDVSHKQRELEFAREKFPNLPWGRWSTGCPKGDNKILGQSAAACIYWLGHKIGKEFILEEKE